MQENRKVLIIGFGTVGNIIHQHLSVQNSQIIVADIDKQAVQDAQSRGCKVFELDLTKDENLIKLGIGKDITDIFCVTGNQELNLFITLAIRALDKKVKILSRAQDSNQKDKLLLAGANVAVDIGEMVGVKLYNSLKNPHILEFIDGVLYKENSFFFKNEIILEEVEVPKGSFLDGEYMYMLDFKESFNLILLGIADKEISENFIFNTGKNNNKIDAGDILVIIGKYENVEEFKATLSVD